MCDSAQIWADFRKYELFGGKLNIKEFTKLAGWTKKGNWSKVVPKALRRAMTDAASGVLDVGTVKMAREAEADVAGSLALRPVGSDAFRTAPIPVFFENPHCRIDSRITLSGTGGQFSHDLDVIVSHVLTRSCKTGRFPCGK